MDVPQLDRRAHPPGLATGAWAAGDGWVLRRFDWPAQGARGRLLFLSGRADFTEKYIEALAHWHARGWAVTSFDWRGQGGSRGAGAYAGGFDTLLDDLGGIVPQAPDVVIAHSMGGQLAARMVVERGWRPRALVLSAPMLGVNAGPVPAWAARGLARGAVALGLGMRALWRGIAHDSALRQANLTGSRERFDDELWWAAANPGWAARPPTWGWLAAAYESMRGLERAATPGDLPPILVLLAAREHLVSNVAARRIAGRWGADIRLLPGAHELLREAEPVRAAMLAAIDGFLDAHVPR